MKKKNTKSESRDNRRELRKAPDSEATIPKKSFLGITYLLKTTRMRVKKMKMASQTIKSRSKKAPT